MFAITKDHEGFMKNTAIPYSPGLEHHKTLDLVLDDTPVHLPIKFRLYDDDSVLYFSGLMRVEDDMLEPEFEPLDWAMPNFGCTRIDVWNPKTKNWETV